MFKQQYVADMYWKKKYADICSNFNVEGESIFGSSLEDDKREYDDAQHYI